MNSKRIASALGLPLVAALVLAGGTPALASGGGGKIVTGNCSSGADWKLKVKNDNGGLEVEYEVDSNVAGQTWKVKITDNGNKVYAGKQVTKGASGSFSVERRTANLAGQDVVVATATNIASGETCSGSLTF